MRKKRKPRDFFVCPHCGADVEVGAVHCKECGSDEETGWSETAYVAELDLPAGYGGDEDFDYDEFAEKELDLPRHFSQKPGIKKYWPYIAGLVLLFFVMGILYLPLRPSPEELQDDPDAVLQKMKEQMQKKMQEMK